MGITFQKNTVSLCNTCYAEIPATVVVDNEGVFLHKYCYNHGLQKAMIERDSLFYSYVSNLPLKGIYPGFFIDVTRYCNLRCDYCYYPLEQPKEQLEQYSIPAILNDVSAQVKYPNRFPIIVTGGEPTSRPDISDLLVQLSAIGPVDMLTNGTYMADDEKLCKKIFPSILADDNVLRLDLSIHHRNTEKWKMFIERLRKCKLKIRSALIVIDSKESLYQAVDICRSISDIVCSFRIKIATKIWNEKKPSIDDTQRIFVSDLYGWLSKKYTISILNNMQNNEGYVNVVCDGIHLILVGWNDTTNVDLISRNTPPYYRAKNGEIFEIVVSFMINEGMSKGWLKGQQIKPI